MLIVNASLRVIFLHFDLCFSMPTNLRTWLVAHCITSQQWSYPTDCSSCKKYDGFIPHDRKSTTAIENWLKTLAMVMRTDTLEL